MFYDKLVLTHITVCPGKFTLTSRKAKQQCAVEHGVPKFELNKRKIVMRNTDHLTFKNY